MGVADNPRSRTLMALALASVASVGLFAASVAVNREWEYSWLVWNLFLAWVPVGLALWLADNLSKKRWLSWQNLLLTGVWLLFLPNSFYIVADFIHLFGEPRGEFMLDLVMFTSFAVNGLMLGFLSLYLVHNELHKRLGGRASAAIVASVLFLCSYAIFVGRFLRWNSWDVIINAPSVLFEVSDTIINAGNYRNLLSTTLGVFVLLGSTYLVIWQLRRR